MDEIVVVGAGALGSHAVLFLRNAAARIRVIDFDRVEARNVASQFHGRPGVGKSKVVSLAQTMPYLFGRKVEGLPHRLGPDNVDVLLSGAGLVLDCLDNGASRRVVQGYVRAADVPCVHGALAPDGSFGRVVWDAGFVVDDEPGTGAATCEDGAHLPFIALVAAYLAHAADTFLSRKEKLGFQVHPMGATPI